MRPKNKSIPSSSPASPKTTKKRETVPSKEENVQSAQNKNPPVSDKENIPLRSESIETKVKVIPNDQECQKQQTCVENVDKIDINTLVKKVSNTLDFADYFMDENCFSNNVATTFRASKTSSFQDKRNLIPIERVNELRKRVQEAIRLHKIFTVRGCFYSIRKSLLHRGWIEKLDAHRKIVPHTASNVVIEDIVQQLPIRRPGESKRQHIIKCERNLMSRLLEYVTIDFLWTCRKERTDWIDMARNPGLVINKFNKVPYTTKEGLCSMLKEFHWFYETGVSEIFFPRCYNVWKPEEMAEFVENYKLTACVSLLKWFVDTAKKTNIESVSAINGKVPFTCINFSIRYCSEYISSCLHFDIDNEDVGFKIWEHEWEIFYTHHSMLTNENERLMITGTTSVEKNLQSAEKVLAEIKPFWPQLNVDGYLNIWIVKPGNRCRGRGIHILHSLKEILNLINPNMVAKTRYVVQKYIEKPLIIHNTKFDIRQWFLVTSVQPLVVWMYKESYLRFSSQAFNLRSQHESVHLTNHAVQKKYTNCLRDERLPTENMWDCHTFQTYLRQIGQVQMWSDRIYPGMQQAIVGSMLASQEHMDRRPHSFELFGADFMISEDFYPWLIEINSSPDLGASTSVTARLCPQCLEDVVKVVVDRRYNPNVETGSFEMIYKQIIPPPPAYMGLNLFLKGKQIFPRSRKEKNKPNHKPSKSGQLSSNGKQKSNTVTGPAVVDFVECLTKNNVFDAADLTRHLHGTTKSIKHGIHLKGKTENNKTIKLLNRFSSVKSTDKNKTVTEDFFRNHSTCAIKCTKLESILHSAQPLPKSQKDKIKSKKKIECVGTKCLEKLETTTPLTSLESQTTKTKENKMRKTKKGLSLPGSRSSSRKPSPENLTNINSTNSKPMKLRRNYYISSNGIRKVPQTKSAGFIEKPRLISPKYPKHNNKSNLLAIGLSLNNWRSKYSKITHSNKENLKIS